MGEPGGRIPAATYQQAASSLAQHGGQTYQQRLQGVVPETRQSIYNMNNDVSKSLLNVLQKGGAAQAQGDAGTKERAG